MSGPSGLTLYVSTDRKRTGRHDVGSVLCLHTAEALTAPPEVHDARSIAVRPAWLTGTPTLVDSVGNVWRGFEAVAHLQSLALADAQRSGLAQSRSANTNSTARSHTNSNQTHQTHQTHQTNQPNQTNQTNQSHQPHQPPQPHPPPMSAPPSEPSAPPSDTLWESVIPTEGTEEENSVRKVTQEDLARAAGMRSESRTVAGDAPPPPQLAD